MCVGGCLGPETEGSRGSTLSGGSLGEVMLYRVASRSHCKKISEAQGISAEEKLKEGHASIRDRKGELAGHSQFFSACFDKEL